MSKTLVGLLSKVHALTTLKRTSNLHTHHANLLNINNSVVARLAVRLQIAQLTQRKQTKYTLLIRKDATMSAAKSLTDEELEQVQTYIQSKPNAQRNRAMLMMTVWAGLRVSEVAGLRYDDVVDIRGRIKRDLLLAAHRVKHNHARTIYINERLRGELEAYIGSRTWVDTTVPLFSTNRGQRHAFSANTLTQHFYWLYKRAGISNASSHSGRKTFLTSLSGKGISVVVLAKLAGHRSITTTQRYITVNDDLLRKAVELV